MGPVHGVAITVDWSAWKTVSTAATVEVDVMPFLGRTPEGGPFSAYYEALSNLGADFVRFSPWFPYPRVAVAELTPSDCTSTKPATNWNSTLFDGVVRDFMAAVCGPSAVLNSSCTHSVAQQLSTMPAWLYKGQYPRPAGSVPADAWEYNSFDAYSWNAAELVDETCEEMAAYVARVVAHYTRGGHHDACGHWHPSGFHYQWDFLSVLNENEHSIGGDRYVKCFDAWRRAVAGVNPHVTLIGPETVIWQGSLDYTPKFIDPKNHDGSGAPRVVTNHWASSEAGGTSGEGYFKALDGCARPPPAHRGTHPAPAPATAERRPPLVLQREGVLTARARSPAATQ